MSSDGERKTFGTLADEAPVTRDDLERALRALHLGDLEARDMLLRLAAQVVALTEASPPDVQERVQAAIPEVFDRIRTNDARTRPRVWMDTSLDNKYDVASSDVPCAELIPLCHARCCTLRFPLSSADLDEGVIRWDYGKPYQIRQRASDGYCVHNDPTSRGCTVHPHRPAICRKYDCRDDHRIWIDFEKRVPAPLNAYGTGRESVEPFDLVDRAKRRAAAEAVEQNAITHTYPDDEPRVGPTPSPRKPRTRDDS
jgi:Fe-S-cluster containining protein